MKEKCNCGEDAVYLLLSAGKDYGNPYYCDNCVPRGCSCNLEPNNGNYDSPDEWVQPKDEHGREYPCCEFDYSKEGYAKDGYDLSSVKCDLCSYQWVACRPDDVLRLECPNCGNMVHFENVS